MIRKTVLHWFRQDLRLKDNPALMAAEGQCLLPVFIQEEEMPDLYRPGSASNVWLHHSLQSLNQSLQGNMSLYKGNLLTILQSLVEQFDIDTVTWNACYDPWRQEQDKIIQEALEGRGVTVHVPEGSTLWDPRRAVKGDGSPYKVFTPFYKNAVQTHIRQSLEAPRFQEILQDSSALSLDELGLLPEKRWGARMMEAWDPGEAGAQAALEHFLSKGLDGYKEGRNYPAKRHASRLSPHLHFGEISPNQAWQAALQHREPDENTYCFLSEIGWREFSHSLLYHFPEMVTENLQKKFDAFPWVTDKKALDAWKQGQTGYPIVDAGMRELWQTGYMHNRVRMIVGSFLVKNLLIHWQEGAQWFWDCLVDADMANNTASWQWIAGCGADAAPYFRIFNPVTQGQKFDPEGTYIKKYVPELADLPLKYLYAPWEAPHLLLRGAGVIIGETYPSPVVDLKLSRARALDAFHTLKANA